MIAMEEMKPREHKKKKKEKQRMDAGSGDIVEEEERRRKKLLRHAKKQAKLFAELGLDENGNPIDNFSILKYPVREWKFTLPGSKGQIALNPVVTLIGIVCLWSLVIWCRGKFSFGHCTFRDWGEIS
jgi:hypothetical protein